VIATLGCLYLWCVCCIRSGSEGIGLDNIAGTGYPTAGPSHVADLLKGVLPAMFVSSIKIAVLITLVALSAAPPKNKATEKTDKMFPDGLEYDFGTLPRGTKARHAFRIVNTSNLPLRMIKWHPAGCCAMTVRPTTIVLQPNEEGKVEILLETARFSGSRTYSGYFNTDNGKTTAFRVRANSQQDPTRK
jgi:hypothetical protein